MQIFAHNIRSSERDMPRIHTELPLHSCKHNMTQIDLNLIKKCNCWYSVLIPVTVHQINLLNLGGHEEMGAFILCYLIFIIHIGTNPVISLLNSEFLPVKLIIVGYTCKRILVYTSLQSILRFLDLWMLISRA